MFCKLVISFSLKMFFNIVIRSFVNWTPDPDQNHQRILIVFCTKGYLSKKYELKVNRQLLQVISVTEKLTKLPLFTGNLV